MSNDHLTRRQFLASAVAACSTLGLTSCVGTSKIVSTHPSTQLNIFSWADYLFPNAISEFERLYGVHVNYDTYASNESLLAKLQAGASSYDVIVPTSYMVITLKKLGLLSTLDKDKLPNFRNILPRFQNQTFDPHCEHSIPYTWGTTGIAFNAKAFGNDEKKYPKDWDIFWDKKLASRMTLLDDARETLGMALKRRGHSYNSLDKSQIQEACCDLKQQKPLVMSYTSDQVIIQLASGDSLASLAYSGDVYQAIRDNQDVLYRIPESGASIWSDNLCIPKTAPHKENAYKWLNFMMQPEIAAACANYTRYATPNEKAQKMIESDLLSDKNLYPPENILAKCEEIGDIGSMIFFYDQMWTELKCS